MKFQLVAFVHFIFICNAMFGTGLVGAYLFYNILFILAMFWSIHCKESIESIQTVSIHISLNYSFEFLDILFVGRTFIIHAGISIQITGAFTFLG